MSGHRQQRVLLNLALFAFILCVTNRYNGSLVAGLGKLAVFVACVALLFFVVQQAPAVYRLTLACVARLVCREALLPPAAIFRLHDRTIPRPTRLILLSCWAQRPPPAASL